MKKFAKAKFSTILLPKSLFVLAFVLCTNTQLLYGQSILQNVLNASSSSKVINGQLHEFSIGEMVLVETFMASSRNALLSQGFLQPNYQPVSINNLATDVRVVNNVVSPNNDGVNDYFVIEGLGKYPGSKLSIYDKAGRRIYTATNYQNEWDGIVDGKSLNEDAYYYVIDLGSGFGSIKGSISIVLK
ncbi:MAG TPA: gliding motility-associated C-terminal domain-containing protein [Daejeonella sp.]|nr:gliding motility-associated C-terminal domain-containing protein [Daejeonella sp.]